MVKLLKDLWLYVYFSPQQTSLLRALTAVELKVYCLESRLTDVLTKMKTFIKESDVFDSNFYRLRYPSNY